MLYRNNRSMARTESAVKHAKLPELMNPSSSFAAQLDRMVTEMRDQVLDAAIGSAGIIP